MTKDELLNEISENNYTGDPLIYVRNYNYGQVYYRPIIGIEKSTKNKIVLVTCYDPDISSFSDEEVEDQVNRWIKACGLNEINLPNAEYIQMKDAYISSITDLIFENRDLKRNIKMLKDIIGNYRTKCTMLKNQINKKNI